MLQAAIQNVDSLTEMACMLRDHALPTSAQLAILQTLQACCDGALLQGSPGSEGLTGPQIHSSQGMTPARIGGHSPLPQHQAADQAPLAHRLSSNDSLLTQQRLSLSPLTIQPASIRSSSLQQASHTSRTPLRTMLPPTKTQPLSRGPTALQAAMLLSELPQQADYGPHTEQGTSFEAQQSDEVQQPTQQGVPQELYHALTELLTAHCVDEAVAVAGAKLLLQLLQSVGAAEACRCDSHACARTLCCAVPWNPSENALMDSDRHGWSSQAHSSLLSCMARLPTCEFLHLSTLYTLLATSTKCLMSEVQQMKQACWERQRRRKGACYADQLLTDTDCKWMQGHALHGRRGSPFGKQQQRRVVKCASASCAALLKQRCPDARAGRVR